MSQSFWRCQSGNPSARSVLQGLTSCDTPPHLHAEQLNYTLSGILATVDYTNIDCIRNARRRIRFTKL